MRGRAISGSLVRNNLDREKDVVFKWEPIIKATFDDLGLQEDSFRPQRYRVPS